MPRPVVTTIWRDWVLRHPRTRVLDIVTGHVRDYTPGRPYGAYYGSPDTMFPVFPRSSRLATEDHIFVLRLDPARKVYPLAIFDAEPVVNDTVAATACASAPPRSRRAHRGGSGERWRIEEEALVTGTRRLPRLAGHLAYWFGWFAFHPDTPVYGR